MKATMKATVMCFGMLLALLALPARAEAKGIPLIYNSGDQTFATGPLPAPFDTAPQLEGFQAGYLCQVQGVFWTYFWVSDCKPVAFKDDRYVDDAELVKAITAKYTEADMQRGFWGRFGWMLMALVVVAGAGIWIKELVTGKSDDDDEKAPEDAS